VNESAPRHPNRFLADLTSAMKTTAESARQATLEQVTAESKAYVEQLHSRTSDGSDSLRRALDEDVATIRERAKIRVERVRSETEQRISRRRQLLEQELQEYNAAVELEIQRVKERVDKFETEVSAFFETLLQGADPTTFATMASQMPDAPAFIELDRETLAHEFRISRGLVRPVEASPVPTPAGSNGKKEELAEGWWLDSAAGLSARLNPDGEQ
jgi:hypothetical protein